jgi:hypothetical protein
MAESAVPEGFDGFMERVEVNGILYDRIPWGAEFPWHSGCPACGEESGRPHAASCPRAANTGEALVMSGPLRPCRDCGANVGEIHAFNCGLEDCPNCHHQFASCECSTPFDRPDDDEDEG